MKNKIIEIAERYDADIVGFAPASRFDKDDAIFKIMPSVKTVIGLGFRVLRGIYRGVEEGTTYYQYTTMGVENLEETVMPLALINVANVIEEEGFEAIAKQFEGVASVEKHHEERYLKLLSNIEKGEVWERVGPTRWQCRNCGAIVDGEKAPDVCPVCFHKKAYFQLEANNY